MENNMNKKVDINNVLDIWEQLEKDSREIPFGNSDFQTEKFVIASSITPERAYRAVCINLRDKLNTISLASDNLLASKLEVEKKFKDIDKKLKSKKLTDIDKVILSNEKRRLVIQINHTEKQIEDMIYEANVLYKHYQALPKYTKEQFERGEARYYLESLKRQAIGLDGAKGSLMAMFDDTKALENFEEKYAALPQDQKHLLEKITEESLTNLSDNPVITKSGPNDLLQEK